jgi:AAA-like domain/TIR domain
MAERRFRYHVFLSHNNVQKDWVRRLAAHLRDEGLSVFFDEDSIELGEDIVLAIERALRASRHILLVLSPEALASQWVALELSTSLYRDPSAAARTIIPILHTDCDIPLTIARLRYLDARSDDFSGQVNRLLRAIDRVAVTEQSPLVVSYSSESQYKIEKTPFQVGGALSPDTTVYVEREADRHLQTILTGRFSMCTLWGPRQTGKTSMVVRALSYAKKQGDQIAVIDFSGLGGGSLPQVLYKAAYRIAEQLHREPPAAEPFLSPKLGPERAFRRFLLNCASGIIIAFDEVDYLRSIGELSSFFQMLRALYSEVAIGHRTDISFVVSSFLAPHRFIEDQLTSPFNVGSAISLENFTWDQSRLLFEKGRVQISDDEFELIYAVTGGQPFLVHRSAAIIHSGGSAQEIITSASMPDGPFGMHLQGLQAMIEQSPNGKQTLIAYLAGRTLGNSDTIELLELGVLRRYGQKLQFACQAYEGFFTSQYRGA